MAGGGAIETWRGGVNSWQCDLMGHLNVRFHVAHATEALGGLAAALGMPRAFAPRGASTLVVREHHIRFLAEARVGDGLHMTCGLTGMGESDAGAFQLLVHSGSGQPAAAFHTSLMHVRSADAQPFPWPQASRARAEDLRIEVPEALRPRSLEPGRARRDASSAGAEKAGMGRYACGLFGPEDCDVFGRVTAGALMGRLGDGAAHEIAMIRRLAGEALGVAVVEYRLAYLDWPGAGDRYDIRSGLKTAEPRRLGFEHWVLNPGTGRPWALAEAVLLPFDLEARKSVTLDEAAVKRLREGLVRLG
jgi:acyl-CoA thioester hydrolase